MDTDLAWFPLVLRERPAGQPLEARIAELERLAGPAAGQTRPGQITRACEVLNKAPLIASDCGLPTLARALCWQQYELFEQAKPWSPWAIKLAMQPLLNIARQRIREGNGDNSLALLESLYAQHVPVTASPSTVISSTSARSLTRSPEPAAQEPSGVDRASSR